MKDWRFAATLLQPASWQTNLSPAEGRIDAAHPRLRWRFAGRLIENRTRMTGFHNSIPASTFTKKRRAASPWDACLSVFSSVSAPGLRRPCHATAHYFSAHFINNYVKVVKNFRAPVAFGLFRRNAWAIRKTLQHRQIGGRGACGAL